MNNAPVSRTVLRVGFGVAGCWLALWIVALSGWRLTGGETEHRRSVDSSSDFLGGDEVDGLESSRQQRADSSDYIFVGELLSAASTSETESALPSGGARPPRVRYMIRVDVRVKEGLPLDDVVAVVHDISGDVVVSVPPTSDQTLGIGQRYFVTARNPVSGDTSLLPGDLRPNPTSNDAFTLITSQEQEDALVREYRELLDDPATPEAAPEQADPTSATVLEATATAAPSATPVPATETIPTATVEPSVTSTPAASPSSDEEISTATAEPAGD